jgi:hypothetical protein
MQKLKYEMSSESELLRSGTNCNPLQIMGLSKKGDRSGMRRNSSSQTENNKSTTMSTIKWQVRADIK